MVSLWSAYVLYIENYSFSIFLQSRWCHVSDLYLLLPSGRAQSQRRDQVLPPFATPLFPLHELQQLLPPVAAQPQVPPDEFVLVTLGALELQNQGTDLGRQDGDLHLRRPRVGPSAGYDLAALHAARQRLRPERQVRVVPAERLDASADVGVPLRLAVRVAERCDALQGDGSLPVSLFVISLLLLLLDGVHDGAVRLYQWHRQFVGERESSVQLRLGELMIEDVGRGRQLMGLFQRLPVHIRARIGKSGLACRVE